MTPIGFRPAEATLQCPVVGHCINHPSTIDLSRVFGAGTENAPLPAHSHVVDQVEGNWWELHVIGVKDPATWDQVVAGKSLAAVRALQAADPTGAKITPEILTRSEEHTSELQSLTNLVCRLLLEKKKKQTRLRTKDSR